MTRPAYYAPTGTTAGDLVAILHLPYTLWHLSYVAIGAGLATTLDGWRLIGTVTAFFFGLGIGAHALDEYNGRPLGTRVSDRSLLVFGVGGLASSLIVAVIGAVAISPWVLAWALAGILMAAAYSLEWSPLLHTDLGFAVAWGAFPVVVGYWAQSLTVSLAAILAAVAAVLFSLAQRRLSTPARFVRRRTESVELSFNRGESSWEKGDLLA
ncbi:MAG: hypothetical protein ACE5MI_05425, partial [Acidimicrobiia bacterium]